MGKFISDAEMEEISPSKPKFISDDEMSKLEEQHNQKAGIGQTALEHFGNGAAFGYLPQAQAATERLVDNIGEGKDKILDMVGLDHLASIDHQLRAQGFKLPDESYLAARDANIKRMAKQAKDNPITAGLAGLAGGIAIAPAIGGPAAAATRGGRILQAAKLGTVFGGLANPGDVEGEVNPLQADKRLENAAKGGVLGGVLGTAVEGASGAVDTLAGSGKKANAADIESATRMLGAEPTPGMVSSSPAVGKLESQLHQSPTIGGWLARKGTKPVGEALEGATKELTSGASNLSPFETGEQAKKILSSEIENKFAPHSAAFEDLKKYTPDIPVPASSIKAVSRNIMNIPEVETLDLPLARQVVKALEKDPSVDQVKMLKTLVGREAKASKGNAATGYWSIYAKLSRLEENSLKRGILESARTSGEGNTIASGMLGQLKGAKKGWSEQMGNLEELFQNSRLGKVGNPENAAEKLGSIPSERLQEKLLPLNDVRLAKTMQNQFPEAFGNLKSARIRDLSEGVEKDSRFLPGKFLQNTKGLNPEAETMLFGEQAPKLDAMRTVHESLPPMVGPSGTEQAMNVREMLNPIVQGRDLLNYGAYKALSSDKLQKVAQFLKGRPAFASMAERSPRAFEKLANKIGSSGGGPSERPIDEAEARSKFIQGN